MKSVRSTAFLCAMGMLSLAMTANATVVVGGLFSDHTVLQRDKPCPVCGTAAPAYDGSGRFDGALSLNGSSLLGIDAARTALPSGLNVGANPFSVSVWMKTTSPIIAGWISWGAWANVGIRILPNTGGTTRVERWGNDYAVDSGKDLRDGDWHNVVFTYDYAGNRAETFYVDGAKVGTGRTNTWTPGTDLDSQPAFTVGQNWNQDVPFNGLLDDLLIVNHVLTQPEITALQSGIGLAPETDTSISSVGSDWELFQ